jgi:hypothetical protein
MKVRCELKTCIPTLVLRSTPVHQSNEGNAGVNPGPDREGSVVGIGIVDTSRRVAELHS